MGLLVAGLLAGVVALVSFLVPRGEKVDFYDASSFEAK